MTIKLYYGGKRLYSNRIIGEDLGDPDYTFENINFIQGDGINTTLTLNNVNAEEGPSYLTSTDDSGNTTEWFVLSSTKTRKNQLVLNLRRDFLDENWDDISAMPFLCNKAATITETTSNAQYLKTTSLSQVKTSQTKLSDRTDGQGWIIGYVAKDFIANTSGDNGATTSLTFTADANADNYDIYVADISNTNSDFYRYINTGVRSYTACTTTQKMHYEFNGYYYSINVSCDIHTGATTDIPGTPYVLAPAGWSIPAAGRAVRNNISGVVDLTYTGLINANATVASILRDTYNYQTGSLTSYDGKIIKDGTSGNRYNVAVYTEDIDLTDAFNSTYLSDLRTSFYTAVSGDTHGYFTGYSTASVNTVGLSANVVVTIQRIRLTLIKSNGDSVTLRNNRVHTLDSLYDIFAIPLGGTITIGVITDPPDEEGDYGREDTEIDCSSMTQQRAMSIINAISEKLGATGASGTYLYDVQWLPYGPISEGNILFAAGTDITSDTNFSLITNSGTNVGCLIWLQSSQLTKSIRYSIDIPKDLLERRIYEEETLVRLSGPNFSSQFEFSPIKNNGLERFNIYIQYKPFNPYIRVVPKFGGLYGINTNDARGLILSGDFSCDSTSDAWTTYKLQNKNYELIFNRQIESMDLQNEYQNNLAQQAAISEGIGIVTSTISSASRGAGSGYMMGGGVGAAVGGVVSGAASLVGGIVDYSYNQQNREMERAIRDDTRDATIDNFQYQIGNIKAMPNTLTKISAFNPDYQIYPVVEIYKCTKQEDLNLRLSIQYNGIDINEMTTLSDYSSGYIQGSLMQIDGLNLNDAQAMTLNSELEYGIYYKEV